MNITVIGAGYVGIVTGACFSKMGNKVYCVDIDKKKIDNLKENIMPIYEPNLKTLVKECQNKNDLIFTNDINEALLDSNIIFISVGTPMDSDGNANLKYIFSASKDIANNIIRDSLVVVKSTVPVGTCFKIKSYIEDILSKNGSDLKIEVVSNPEFLKEGNAIEDCLHPDRVVIGCDKYEIYEILKDLYSPFVLNNDRFILMDTKSAEMTKYVSNAMLATKISFMNEMANICEVTGADIKNVRLGVGSDKRIGYDYIYAGCGYGGSCFPKDVRALIKIAEINGYKSNILSNVEVVNQKQKMILVEKIINKFGNDFSNFTFAIWGLSFKPDTNDVRDATSLVVISEIIKRGGKVKVYDPKAQKDFKKEIGSEYLESIEFMNNRYGALQDCDALVLITEWKEFRNPDFNILSEMLKQKVIFDGRNIYNKRILDWGFELYQIGC